MRRDQEELHRLAGRLITVQEEERKRIARDLHDDINQRIALVVLNLQDLSQQPPASMAELRRRISEQSEIVSELGRDVGALSHRLHSSKLEYLGLAAPGASLCREISEHQKVKIDFHSDGIPKDLPQEVSLCLFRVMQEALQNGIKHSGARHFEVRMSSDLNAIQLSVRDSGVGFELDEALKGRGVGLSV